MKKMSLIIVFILILGGIVDPKTNKTINSLIPIEEDPGLIEFKQMYNFDNWPGKNSDLISGFRFLKDEYSQLIDYLIERQILTFSPTQSGGVIQRYITLFNQNTKEKVQVVVTVAQGASVDVHEWLIQQYYHSPYHGIRRSGSEFGLDLGDFSFPFYNERDELIFIDFVRNNILIQLYSDDKTINFSDIAKGIDEKLKIEPTYNNLSLSGLQPIIDTLSIKPDTISIFSRKEIVVKVRDPIDNFDELEFQFSENHLGYIDQKHDKFSYVPTEIGIDLIKLILINQKNLCAQDSINVIIK